MVPFSTNLHKARLEKRYKRFFADVILEDGTKATAHCPNTGSMATCMSPGATVWLTFSDDPKRKLKWTWELTETSEGYIGINTAMPNRVVEHSVQAGLIPELAGYATMQREVKYGSENSRIDLLLSDTAKPQCYVEVKNTTLIHDNHVRFPDAVTERGQKHLRELAAMAKKGHRAVIFFFVNRSEGEAFSPADHIDPVYGKLLREAKQQGVEILAYRAKHTLTGITTGSALDVIL